MVGVFGNDTEARLPGSAKYKAKTAATAATAVVPSGAKSVEVGGARLGKRSRVIEVPKTSYQESVEVDQIMESATELLLDMEHEPSQLLGKFREKFRKRMEQVEKFPV